MEVKPSLTILLMWQKIRVKLFDKCYEFKKIIGFFQIDDN